MMTLIQSGRTESKPCDSLPVSNFANSRTIAIEARRSVRTLYNSTIHHQQESASPTEYDVRFSLPFSQCFKAILSLCRIGCSVFVDNVSGCAWTCTRVIAEGFG